jgi:hypothetical protein
MTQQLDMGRTRPSADGDVPSVLRISMSSACRPFDVLRRPPVGIDRPSRPNEEDLDHCVAGQPTRAG